MPIVRARDVRSAVKDMGFEKGIVWILEQALEEFAEYRQHIKQVVELQQQMIDNLERLQHVGVSMQHHIARINRTLEASDGDEDS